MKQKTKTTPDPLIVTVTKYLEGLESDTVYHVFHNAVDRLQAEAVRIAKIRPEHRTPLEHITREWGLAWLAYLDRKRDDETCMQRMAEAEGMLRKLVGYSVRKRGQSNA